MIIKIGYLTITESSLYKYEPSWIYWDGCLLVQTSNPDTVVKSKKAHFKQASFGLL